ncbi:MAG: leucine-rich repeat protein [Clostridia bacterium]|nr:leucine-rich repeat protein [Clostridia bacterium]
MKNALKKAISVLLVAVMVIGATPQLECFNLKVEAANYSGMCGDNLMWSFDNSTGELIIGGVGDMTRWINSGDIPWDNYRSSIKKIVIDTGVTSISSSAFALCDISTITIPDTVTRIDGYAFAFCYKLENITIGKGVSNIDEMAFYDCRCIVNVTVDSANTSFSSDEYGVLFNKDKTVLIQYPAGSIQTSYIIPNSVIALNSRAFYFCENLKDVIIPNGVTDIPSETFAYCRNLTSITIPNAVTSIGDFAFEYCDSLDDVMIGNDINRIGHWAFYGTGYYNNSSNWENNVLYIGKYLINAQKNISGFYKIKDETTVISDYAFYGCENIEAVTMPNTITSIGDYAFLNCCKIKNIEIPNGVKNIGISAFNSCDNLENIIVDSDNSIYSSDTNGVLFDKNKTILIQYPSGKTETYYEVPSGVTTIMDDSFGDCSNITSVTIPDSVTNAGDRTFYDCDSLVSVNLGNGITCLGFMLFYGCDNLSSVIIPDSVTSIESSAFEDCTSLMNITIPDSVTSIGRFVFDGTGVYKNFSNWENDVLYIDKCLVDAKNSISGSCIVKDGTTVIAEIAFENCNSLTSITIPDSMTNIGAGAFWNSNSLTDVYYNNSASQWDKIKIGYDNEPLKNARIHFEHTHKVNTVAERIEPNCNDSGYIKGYCICGQSFKEETPSLGHDIVIDKSVDSTCTETGLTEGQHCSRCDGATVEQEIVPVKPHIGIAKYDSEKHWKECICGSKIDVQNHSFVGGNTCSCGFKKVVDSTIKIKNNNGSKTINYGETLKLTATVTDKPANSKIYWYVDGFIAGEGEVFNINFEKGTKIVTVKLVDSNGVVYQNANGDEIADSETVTINSGFFQKIISFFKNLFGINRTVVQAFKVIY